MNHDRCPAAARIVSAFALPLCGLARAAAGHPAAAQWQTRPERSLGAALRPGYVEGWREPEGRRGACRSRLSMRRIQELRSREVRLHGPLPAARG